MTRRLGEKATEAVERCIEMWTYIRDMPHSSEALGFAMKEEAAKKVSGGKKITECYLCHYTLREGAIGEHCNFSARVQCPLITGRMVVHEGHAEEESCVSRTVPGGGLNAWVCSPNHEYEDWIIGSCVDWLMKHGKGYEIVKEENDA